MQQHPGKSDSHEADSECGPRQLLDLKRALERYRGDKTLLADMIGFYLSDYQDLCNQADVAAEREEWDVVARSAHSLKGISANYDSDSVTQAASEVESAALDDRSSLPPLLKEMRQEAERLAECLKVWLSEYQSDQS